MESAGAKSTMSRDMQELTQGKEDVSNQIQGHKANLSNPSKSLPSALLVSHHHLPLQKTFLLQTLTYVPPDTSEQSKQNSANAIEELGGEANHYGKEDQPHSKSAAETLEGSRAM